MKFIAFNILSSQGTLFNPTSIPILYEYIDEQGEDLYASMTHNDAFNDLINTTCMNIKEYPYSKISMVLYDDNTGIYSDNVTYIQDIYNITNELADEYLLDIFKYLYKYSLKTDYESKFELAMDMIIDIYSRLIERFKSKINKTTLKEYIRSQLQQKYKLNTDNTDKIIERYESITK